MGRASPLANNQPNASVCQFWQYLRKKIVGSSFQVAIVCEVLSIENSSSAVCMRMQPSDLVARRADRDIDSLVDKTASSSAELLGSLFDHFPFLYVLGERFVKIYGKGMISKNFHIKNERSILVFRQCQTL